MDTVTIRNPNDTGRTAAGVGVVAPHQTKEVPADVALRVCDGDNFVIVEPEPETEPVPQPRRKSSTPSS